MNSLINVTPLAVLAILTVSCSTTDTLSEAADQGSAGVVASAEDAQLEDSPSDEDAALLTIDVQSHPSNSLVALVTVSSESPVEVTVAVSSAGTDERTVTSSTASTVHAVEIVGLRAETEYHFVASAENGSSSEPATFTTGALPAGAPTVEIVQALVGEAAGADATSGTTTNDGITFFGVPPERGSGAAGPTYFGVDAGGFIVWYLDNAGSSANQDPFIRVVDSEILVFLGDSVERMTLGGEVTETRDLSKVDRWHHDAVLLPSGNMLALGRSVEQVNGVAVQGDVIVEVDAAGSVVWEWSTFDHLDLDRYPGPLSLRPGLASDALDWTHANSISYDEVTGQILMSLRSQNWVIAIDRETGEVAWVAGDNVDTESELAAKVLELESGTWTSGQHAATLTTARELLIYDNRNETGGVNNNSRIVVYDLDLDAGTATQTFEFVLPKYTASLGDVDELANGNILVTAGGPGSSDTAHFIEVTRTGEVVWEATTPGRVYRSERMTWAEIDGGGE